MLGYFILFLQISTLDSFKVPDLHLSSAVDNKPDHSIVNSTLNQKGLTLNLSLYNMCISCTLLLIIILSYNRLATLIFNILAVLREIAEERGQNEH